MDLMHSADEIRRLRRLSAYRNRVGLKYKREQAGLSQRDLAEISGVPVKTIQQYEQQQKDIRKAAYETVCRLADALHCAPDETLNNPLWLIFQHSIRSSTEQCRAAARSFSVCACARFKSFRRCS